MRGTEKIEKNRE